VFARLGGSPVWDRGVVLVQLAMAITLRATSMRQIALLAHHEPLFGAPPSDSTIRRALEPIGADELLRKRLARARARVRRHVWELIAATETGFPWLVVAGKVLTGWIVIDLDATLITAHSDKQGASATFKKGYGFHPLAAWCANTQECLAAGDSARTTGSSQGKAWPSPAASPGSGSPIRMRSHYGSARPWTTSVSAPSPKREANCRHTLAIPRRT
jgi:hypothetical protein